MKITDDPNAIRLTLNIGAAAMKLIAIQTNAPVDYDGFGTFTIYESPPAAGERYGERLVLAREEHAHWQQQRYASGMHTAETPAIDMDTVINAVWRKLQAKTWLPS